MIGLHRALTHRASKSETGLFCQLTYLQYVLEFCQAVRGEIFKEMHYGFIGSTLILSIYMEKF